VISREVSELIHGKRNVTPEMAWLLANEFKVSPEFWMNQTTIFVK
jgi:plasmid maintenance system antidote protein VapI